MLKTDGQVSNLLHDQFVENAILDVSMPLGDFFLNETVPDASGFTQRRCRYYANDFDLKSSGCHPVITQSSFYSYLP